MFWLCSLELPIRNQTEMDFNRCESRPRTRAERPSSWTRLCWLHKSFNRLTRLICRKKKLHTWQTPTQHSIYDLQPVWLGILLEIVLRRSRMVQWGVTKRGGYDPAITQDKSKQWSEWGLNQEYLYANPVPWPLSHAVYFYWYILSILA